MSNPNKSHTHFPYHFDGTSTGGINFQETYNYDGDLLIYYSSMADRSNNYISCWCSRWDTQKYSLILETWLTKSEAQTLRNNIRPGAVDELYQVLGKPVYYDRSWQGKNTLRIVPNKYKRRMGSQPDEGDLIKSSLPSMRKERVIYVKTYSEHPLKNNLIEVKLEGYISGSTL